MGAQAKQFALQQSQARGSGVLLSFETGDVDKSQKFVNALKVRRTHTKRHMPANFSISWLCGLNKAVMLSFSQ
jgi:hypothetical protein